MAIAGVESRVLSEQEAQSALEGSGNGRHDLTIFLDSRASDQDGHLNGPKSFLQWLRKSGRRVPVVALMSKTNLHRLDELYGTMYLDIVSAIVVDGSEVDASFVSEVLGNLQAQAVLDSTDAVPIGSFWPCPEEVYKEKKSLSLFLGSMREVMTRLLFITEQVRWPGMPDEYKNRPFSTDPAHRLARAERDEYKDGKKKVSSGRVRHIGDQLYLQAGGLYDTLTSPRPVSKKYPSHILLEGPTGAGKTLLAKWIARRLDCGQPDQFQDIGCTNLAEDELEFELFGCCAGVFTSVDERPGVFLLSWGGVAFLDEIGDLPLPLQVKLLKVLDAFEVSPRGHRGLPFSVPMYIIAATNADLADKCRRGDFRQDLYERFRYRVRIPSLKERSEELDILIDFVVQNPEFNQPTAGGSRTVNKITRRALKMLKKYDFPGNFRELERILAEAILQAKMTRTDVLDAVHIRLPGKAGE